MVADTHPVKHSGGHLVPAPISWVVTLLPLLPDLGAWVWHTQHMGRARVKPTACGQNWGQMHGLTPMQGRHFAEELC